MNDLPPPPPATNTKKKKRPGKIKDASAAPTVASFDPDAPPSPDAGPLTLITPPSTTPKRAKKKARDAAAAAADTTSYLLAGLRKCGVEEKFLESGRMGQIGETELERMARRLKENEDAAAELSAKRAELIANQVSMIMDYSLSSTEDAEGGASNESKPQPEKYLAELLRRDPRFGAYPEHVLTKGLENIPASNWAEMQVEWRHLVSAEWKVDLKETELAACYLELLNEAERLILASFLSTKQDWYRCVWCSGP